MRAWGAPQGLDQRACRSNQHWRERASRLGHPETRWQTKDALDGTMTYMSQTPRQPHVVCRISPIVSV